MQNLIEKFRKAGLDLIIEKNTMRKGRGMEDIFQMDIQRNIKGISRHEKFRIYPGHPDNIIQVRNTDEKTKQLILLVKEPEREFDNVSPITKFNTFKRIKEEAVKRGRGVIRIYKEANDAHIITKAAGGTRYFLLGIDERQLFLAQLRGAATTVEGARQQLGRTVQFADGTRKGSSIDRQGEWFFLETRQTTRDEIERALKETKTAIRKKVNVGQFLGRPGGNPHIADEIVLLPVTTTTDIQRMAGGNPRRLLRNRVFVRGSIRHKDHKTVKFSQWREVIANNEGQTAMSTSSGVFWVD